MREEGGWGQSVIKERKEKFGATRSRKSLLEPSCVQLHCFLLNHLSNCGGAYSFSFNI